MDHKLIREETEEFYIEWKDRIYISLLFYTYPLTTYSLFLLPFIKKRTKKHVERIFEDYSTKAYFTDHADIGLFENFMLKKDACIKVVEDHLERDNQWAKTSMKLRITGIISGSSCNFEIENSEITTKDKKKRMIQIITEKHKIIPFYINDCKLITAQKWIITINSPCLTYP